MSSSEQPASTKQRGARRASLESLCRTPRFGARENHIWYIDTTHMKAKDRPMNAPPSMTTQANGW